MDTRQGWPRYRSRCWYWLMRMVSSHIPKHTFGSRWTLLQRWLHAFQISPWFRAVIALYGSYQSILDINNCFHIDYHRAETCKHQLSQVRAWKTKGRGAKMCTARPSWMSISQQSLGYKDNMYKVAVCRYACLFVFLDTQVSLAPTSEHITVMIRI